MMSRNKCASSVPYRHYYIHSLSLDRVELPTLDIYHFARTSDLILSDKSVPAREDAFFLQFLFVFSASGRISFIKNSRFVNFKTICLANVDVRWSSVWTNWGFPWDSLIQQSHVQSMDALLIPPGTHAGRFFLPNKCSHHQRSLISPNFLTHPGTKLTAVDIVKLLTRTLHIRWFNDNNSKSQIFF